MSKKLVNDAHHLLFNDYKFAGEDRAFLEKIAYSYYTGNGRSRRLTDEIRETLRVLTSYPGFVAQYALHVQRNDASQHAWTAVNEHIAFVGQAGLIYSTLVMSNGPVKDVKTDMAPLELVAGLEKLMHVEGATETEWWLDYHGEAASFQLATFLYEMRRILVGVPAGFKGHVWNDGHGKVHLVLTQVSGVEFADEQLYVHLTVTHPSIFNAAVTEAARQAAEVDG